MAINTKNAAIDIFYSRMFKTQLLLPILSRVFLKCSFIPSVALFLQTWPKKPRPKTCVFCSVILWSNKVYGPIKIHSVNYELQIIDLSYNSFTRMLPVELFQNSNSSRFNRAYHLSYIQVYSSFKANLIYQIFEFQHEYNFSMMMTNKGVDTIYKKVQEINYH